MTSQAPKCPINHDRVESAASTLPGPVRRTLYAGIGWVSVVAGVIGIFLPLWPTTCFLLLAAFCFARSSPRAERWLEENRLFGKYLEQYRRKGVVSSRVRRWAAISLWVSILVSSALVGVGRWWLIVILLLVATAVTLHLYSLPTEMAPKVANTGTDDGQTEGGLS